MSNSMNIEKKDGGYLMDIYTGRDNPEYPGQQDRTDKIVTTLDAVLEEVKIRFG